MWDKLALLVAVVVLHVGTSVAATGSLVLPRLDGFVVDPDDLIPADQEAALEGRLAEVKRGRGVSIVVLAISSLRGEPIEDLAYRAFNQWGLGDRERDDGVLLIVAATDRASRIETGRGVGGDLTDIEAAEILRSSVSSALREGDVPRAVEGGARAIEAQLPTLVAPDAEEPLGLGWLWAVGLAVVMMGLAIVSPAFRAAAFYVLGALWFMRGRGGGGFGGGVGGGGGGSSGGGGASD
jgi:uncharacterized protein